MFSVEMKVRDYECDIQGVVNNAVYQNYLEHARHEFLLAKNIDFAALTKAGIHLMLARIELDFKNSLKPADEFYITVEMEKVSRIKYAFVQNIYRKSDNQHMLKALAIGIALNEKGRPTTFAPLDSLAEVA